MPTNIKSDYTIEIDGKDLENIHVTNAFELYHYHTN